ncbi:putative CoA-substrate-specific enzyme activase [Hydrogenispora ethanolica]|uniref:Putative CoA-substrate-specific enzyme activase n=2 Tax=Hydrogenispora ethanolica TaxID=1082276 RepID=A0A4V2QFU0_HYDET|nr:putative CoA-substrate-specific enzyme activase [Hydrogenispora ethanolica]
MMDSVFLGVDVGSVSTNIVGLDSQDQVVFECYLRNDGQPLQVIQDGLQRLRAALPESAVDAVGVTGSGRHLAAAMVGADIVKNEITAHAAAAVHAYPAVRTILEIGGQDSKIILVRDGVVADFAMNTVCAAGTGSFLDHQAERLKIPIEEFGALALTATHPVKIAGRCTVFAESDMIAKQQFGFSKPDIINGLCEALVRNYLANLARDKAIAELILFQGGVAANQGIKAAFERALQAPVLIPPHFAVMGAIGAALLGKKQLQKTGASSRFRGFEKLFLQFTPATFECSGCSNRCEIIEVKQEQRVIAIWGDKCGKYTNGVPA